MSLDQSIINEKMKELAKQLNYAYDNISFLARAMYSQSYYSERDGKNRENHTNDALATLGDSLLKFFLTDLLYNELTDDQPNKQQITEQRQQLESNDTLYKVFNDANLYQYAYNDEHFSQDAPAENKVPNSKHSPYIEAILGAIYRDKGFEYAEHWFRAYLYDKLKRAADAKRATNMPPD